MKTSEVMTKDVGTCRPEDDLDRAAQVMWERDCGVVPVVDLAGRVVGMVTDRDACMAAYTKGLSLKAIRAGEVMSRPVFSCRAEDELDAIEATMQRQRVRRLPVVDDEGKLVGIVSLNDLARRFAKEGPRASNGLAREITATLASIGKPWCEISDQPAVGERVVQRGVLVPALPR